MLSVLILGLILAVAALLAPSAFADVTFSFADEAAIRTACTEAGGVYAQASSSDPITGVGICRFRLGVNSKLLNAADCTAITGTDISAKFSIGIVGLPSEGITGGSVDNSQCLVNIAFKNGSKAASGNFAQTVSGLRSTAVADKGQEYQRVLGLYCSPLAAAYIKAGQAGSGSSQTVNAEAFAAESSFKSCSTAVAATYRTCTAQTSTPRATCIHDTMLNNAAKYAGALTVDDVTAAINDGTIALNITPEQAETVSEENRAKAAACPEDKPWVWAVTTEDGTPVETFGGACTAPLDLSIICQDGSVAENAALCPENQPATGDAQSTCAIGGVGFIICPVMNFLGDVADKMYEVLQGFLTIQPSMFDSDGAARAAYNQFLPLANIAMIILFLVIIYSTATGNGFGALSNYDVKKTLPRLLIFAILINLSWFICAAVVDISNILGANVKDLFDEISSSVASGPDFSHSALDPQVFSRGNTWTGIISVVLIGGAGIALAGGLAVVMPLLLGVLVVLLVMFLILIVRQVGVVLLVVLAPLAFAMAMLPNTKSVFDKWFKMLLSLLMIYPIIGLIYGGSSLASVIIGGQASDLDEDITRFAMQIAAAACQVLPLVATPFVLKGSLDGLGKVGAMVGGFAAGRMSNAGKRVQTKGKEGWENSLARYGKNKLVGGVKNGKVAERMSKWGREHGGVRGRLARGAGGLGAGAAWLASRGDSAKNRAEVQQKLEEARTATRNAQTNKGGEAWQELQQLQFKNKAIEETANEERAKEILRNPDIASEEERNWATQVVGEAEKRRKEYAGGYLSTVRLPSKRKTGVTLPDGSAEEEPITDPSGRAVFRELETGEWQALARGQALEDYLGEDGHMHKLAGRETKPSGEVDDSLQRAAIAHLTDIGGGNGKEIEKFMSDITPAELRTWSTSARGDLVQLMMKMGGQYGGGTANKASQGKYSHEGSQRDYLLGGQRADGTYEGGKIRAEDFGAVDGIKPEQMGALIDFAASEASSGRMEALVSLESALAKYSSATYSGSKANDAMDKQITRLEDEITKPRTAPPPPGGTP